VLGGPRDVCLIDVYETLLTVDFSSVLAELAAMARVPPGDFRAALGETEASVTIGEVTMADALRRALRSCGIEPDGSLVRDLVDADRRQPSETVRLHDDANAFLEMLKRRGVRSALVSSCAENTRPLLAHLGLDVRVDVVVLSCEAGCAKPSPRMYYRALAELGADPRRAVLVDDQSTYCEGAAALGIAAARIVRDSGDARPAQPGTTVVRSLLDVEPLFSSRSSAVQP